ncbi:MAG: hypothetical protein IPO04_22115 [Cytophagaceae bacterium]|nr:hypothetical protein [Cytophagaceae bacterium]
MSSGVPGELMASLEPGKSYSLQINAGFEPVATKVEATDWIKQNNFERKIFMNPIESAAKESNAEAGLGNSKKIQFLEISQKGKKITLENIYFDQSSPVLRKESFKQLDDLAKILSENPALSIEIRGHTDNVEIFSKT